jgi:hypothetical protein
MSTINKDFDFKINQCKACKIKCPDPADVNCINNCCYETLGAFDGAWSLNQVRNSEAAKNCFDCVSESINCMGTNRCDLRITASPFFNQVPHYFPPIFEETKNVEKAKNMCYSYCLDCRNTKTCMNNCDIDSAAVESFSENKIVTVQQNQQRKYRDTNPFSFYTGFIIGTIAFAFILFLFIRTIIYGYNF